MSAKRATAFGVAAVLALPAGCGAVGRNQGGEDVRPPLRAVNPYGGDPATDGEPKRGGTLVIGNDREVASFDPTGQNGTIIATAVYDLLLRLSPDGDVVPYLAESMQSPDGGVPGWWGSARACSSPTALR